MRLRFQANLAGINDRRGSSRGTFGFTTVLGTTEIKSSQKSKWRDYILIFFRVLFLLFFAIHEIRKRKFHQIFHIGKGIYLFSLFFHFSFSFIPLYPSYLPLSPSYRFCIWPFLPVPHFFRPLHIFTLESPILRFPSMISSTLLRQVSLKEKI